MPRNLNKLIADKASSNANPPEIIRGQGYSFSTDTLPQQTPTPAKAEATTSDGDSEKADRRSVRVRADLLKQCKLIALESDKTLAEVIEQAIEYWLQNQ